MTPSPHNDQSGNKMSERNVAVAIYASYTELERAIRQLQEAGFDAAQLSLLGRSEDPWGLLWGRAFWMIPEIGPVFVSGPLAAWIVATLEDPPIFGKLNIFRAVLHRIGIPADGLLELEAALKAGRFLLIAQGAPEEVDRARPILEAGDMRSRCRRGGGR